MKRTINYRDVELDVEFNFYPEEKMVMYYKDGSGYPGSPAAIEFIEVSIRGTIITDLFDASQMKEIEELIWEVIFLND